jgi:hypothetical protein
LGGLCVLDPPPFTNGAALVVAYGGMPVLKSRQRSPVLGDHVFEIDPEKWRSLAALSCAMAAGASEMPAPVIELEVEPEPEPAPPAVQEEVVATSDVAPAEEVVAALVPNDSPPRIIPGWFVSMVLVIALIAGLSLLVYLLFHTHYFERENSGGEPRTTAPWLVLLPGAR